MKHNVIIFQNNKIACSRKIKIKCRALTDTLNPKETIFKSEFEKRLAIYR